MIEFKKITYKDTKPFLLKIFRKSISKALSKNM